MNVPIDHTIKRVRAYWFIDGFTEISAGGLFILLAGLLLFSGNASANVFPSWFLSMTGEIVIAKLMGILAATLILWWLKDHFTYPRTGFARGKRITIAQVGAIIRNILLFLFMPLLGLLVASLLITSIGSILASMPTWFPIGISLIWAALFIWAGGWMGLPRFRVVGGLIGLSGIAIGISQHISGGPVIPAMGAPEMMQPSVVVSINRTLASLDFLVLTSGVILLCSGIITFLHYRKENPLPYAEDV